MLTDRIIPAQAAAAAAAASSQARPLASIDNNSIADDDDEFLDPITGDVIVDPVVGSDGCTYDRCYQSPVKSCMSAGCGLLFMRALVIEHAVRPGNRLREVDDVLEASQHKPQLNKRVSFSTR